MGLFGATTAKAPMPASSSAGSCYGGEDSGTAHDCVWYLSIVLHTHMLHVWRKKKHIPRSFLGCIILVLSGKFASWKRRLQILAGGWFHISSYLGPIRLQITSFIMYIKRLNLRPFLPLRCTCQGSEGYAQIQPRDHMAKKAPDLRLEDNPGWSRNGNQKSAIDTFWG